MKEKNDIHERINPPGIVNQQHSIAGANIAGRDVVRELSIVYDALESTINGVVITDLRGMIIYANPSFLNMFEYDNRSDLVGRYIDAIFANKEISGLSDIEKMIRDGDGENREFLMRRKNLSTFYVEASSSPVCDAVGGVAGRMASFVDISKRKLAEGENRRLSYELIKSQELERERVARDLHDSVAQMIHVAKINFMAFQKDSETHRDRFNMGIRFLDRVSQELREVCDDLYPSLLKDQGLVSTIRWFVKNYLEVTGIEADMKISLDEDISEDLKVNLYRIVKELFTNIIRHSSARKVKLHLRRFDDRISLVISDDGVGFVQGERRGDRGGYGLSNIRQRVNEFNGSMKIETAPGKGTTTIIEMGMKLV